MAQNKWGTMGSFTPKNGVIWLIWLIWLVGAPPCTSSTTPFQLSFLCPRTLRKPRGQPLFALTSALSRILEGSRYRYKMIAWGVSIGYGPLPRMPVTTRNLSHFSRESLETFKNVSVTGKGAIPKVYSTVDRIRKKESPTQQTRL